MICKNCGSDSFVKYNGEYYCSYCSSHFENKVKTDKDKVDWSKYKNERIKNDIYVKTHCPEETKSEKNITRFLLIPIYILLFPLFIISFLSKNK